MRKSKISRRGIWSKQEDRKLIEYVRSHGEVSWSSVPQAAGLQRSEKSCKLRWRKYLKEESRRANFGDDEEDLLIKLYALLGDRWSLIAGRLPGRKDEEVKNYWESHLSKKLLNKGIDTNNPRSLLYYGTFQNQHIATTSTPRYPLEEVSETDSNMKGGPSELEDKSDVTSRKR